MLGNIYLSKGTTQLNNFQERVRLGLSMLGSIIFKEGRVNPNKGRGGLLPPPQAGNRPPFLGP